jgi:hypothetical protein
VTKECNFTKPDLKPVACSPKFGRRVVHRSLSQSRKEGF